MSRTTGEVYALLAWDRYYPAPNNVIRVFTKERDAEKWAVLLECAARDAHFPVTHAELKQDFDWVPDRKYDVYEAVELEVCDSGWD